MQTLCQHQNMKIMKNTAKKGIINTISKHTAQYIITCTNIMGRNAIDSNVT
jgi:hypothetical protein